MRKVGISQLSLIEARFYLDKTRGDLRFSGAQATFYAVRREVSDPMKLLAVDCLMASLMAAEQGDVGYQNLIETARKLIDYQADPKSSSTQALRQISLSILLLIQAQF